MADGDGDQDGQEPDDNSGGQQSNKELNKLRDELESVRQKKNELLDEKKTEQQKRKELESRMNEIEKEKNIKEQNVEELQEQLEQEKQDAVAEVEGELEKWRQTAEQLLVDNRLNQTLDDLGVAAPYKDSLRYELRQDIEVVDSEEGELPLEAVARDGAKQIDIGDYAQQVLDEKGPEHFLTAPNNNGGGAGHAGSGGSDTNENPLDKASDTFRLTNATEFIQENDDETVQRTLEQAENPIRIDNTIGSV